MNNEETFQTEIQNLPENVKENRIHIRKVIEANNKLLEEKLTYSYGEILEIIEKISYGVKE